MWTHNVFVFLIPLGLTYLLQIQATLMAADHIFSTKDFIPSSFTLGAMSLYVVNTLYDLGRKFVAK